MSKKQKKDVPNMINFHYIKSPHFRVIRVNGAWGGVTPQNEVQVVIYNERFPIPDLITHEINDREGLGKEIKRESKDGLVREVEAVLSIDPKVAKALGIWLLQKVDESAVNSQNVDETEDLHISEEISKSH